MAERNDIGNIKSVKGTSMALNTQKMVGAEKPECKGSNSPGGTKPERVSEKSPPMPK